MTGNGGSYKPHVDAIAIHAYQNPKLDPAVAAKNVLTYADAVHARWGKPVDVTETGGIFFASSNAKAWVFGTDAWTVAFETAFIEGTHSRPHIERYAFYVAVYSEDVLSTVPQAATITQMNQDLSMRPAVDAFASTF